MEMPISLYDLYKNQNHPAYRCAARIADARTDDLSPLLIDINSSPEYNELVDLLEIDFMTDFKKDLARMSKQEMIVMSQNIDLMNSPGYIFKSVSYLQPFEDIAYFLAAGRKTFYFSNNITELLLHTEINVSSDIIRLPFHSCQFVYTSTEISRELTNMLGVPLDNDRITICVFLTERKVNSANKIKIGIYGFANDGLRYLTRRNISLAEGTDLNALLREEWGRGVDMQSTITDGKFHDTLIREYPEDGDLDLNPTLSFFRTIFNSILYLTSSEPDMQLFPSARKDLEKQISNLKSPAKIKKARKRLDRIPSLDYIVVGAHVQQLRSEEMPTAGQEKRRLKSRFLVRGFWRQQACGPGYLNRRLIWVKPFYKGPDIGDIINKTYLVK